MSILCSYSVCSFHSAPHPTQVQSSAAGIGRGMKKEAAAVVPQASKLIRVKARVSGRSSGRAQLSSFLGSGLVLGL